jgi:hypothetical protein
VLERKQLWAKDPAQLGAAAADLALCIPLAAADQAERRRYADLALDTLRQAIGQGFQDARALKEDVAWQPLRTRAEFQELLTALEARAQSPAP